MISVPLIISHARFGPPSPIGSQTHHWASWHDPVTGVLREQYSDAAGNFAAGFNFTNVAWYPSDEGDAPGSGGASQFVGVTVSYPDTPDWDGFAIDTMYVRYESAPYVHWGTGPLRSPVTNWISGPILKRNTDGYIEWDKTNTGRRQLFITKDNAGFRGWDSLTPRNLGLGDVVCNAGVSPAYAEQYFYYKDSGLPLSAYHQMYSAAQANSTLRIEWSDGSVESRTLTTSENYYYINVNSSIAHDFGSSNGAPTRLQLTNSCGQKSKWDRFYLQPYAGATITENDNGDWVLDGTSSFDLDGNIVSWTWFFYGRSGGITVSLSGFTGSRSSDLLFGETVVISPSDAEKYYNTNGLGTNNQVFLRVKDNEGLVWTNFFQLPEIDSIFGSFIDKTGMLFTAVNEGTGVRVSQFKSGAASRELLALIPNSKGPSLFVDNSRRIACGYTHRTAGDYKTTYSTDGGKVFV